MDLENLANESLKTWIVDMASLCKPDDIMVYDGSEKAYDHLCEGLVRTGTFRKLSEVLRPRSFLALSDPADTARVEERTFICSSTAEDAGPTNHWQDPEEMKTRLLPLFSGAMRGRTMYVVPYTMGPHRSPLAKVGVELTDSAYVVVNMHIMTRTGNAALEALGNRSDFVKGLHACGNPATQSADCVDGWPCDPERMTIAHFPEERLIWSYGSGYGGNALLNKKCFALRIASVMARDEGWLAEHMMILSVTNPKGEKKYFAGAFPSACGKTNLAMLNSVMPGWTVKTVGDDIAWMKFGPDGRLYAINAEAGFFGVAPNSSRKNNPNAIRSIEKDTIFTNCALTPDNDIWWEGIGYKAPEGTLDWRGKAFHEADPERRKSGTGPLAHPNSRFTARASNCPSMDENWESPDGVPISAILFGGRRASTIPLVTESFDWSHGVFMGSTLSSETTAAASGETGMLRRDPFAMLPFCGYNIGDYFAYWLSLAERPGAQLPKIYHVNWFRRDGNGHFIWPGYHENMRVLKWIFERCQGTRGAVRSQIGFLPRIVDFDLHGLYLPEDEIEPLFEIDVATWRKEAESIRAYYNKLGARVPKVLYDHVDALETRLFGSGV
jgi:phosphoenolpyruvate carboxykinase (GTP)